MRNALIKFLGGYTKEEFRDAMKNNYRFPKGHPKAGQFCSFYDYHFAKSNFAPKNVVKGIWGLL
jgi:hypothetical protein